MATVFCMFSELAPSIVYCGALVLKAGSHGGLEARDAPYSKSPVRFLKDVLKDVKDVLKDVRPSHTFSERCWHIWKRKGFLHSYELTTSFRKRVGVAYVFQDVFHISQYIFHKALEACIERDRDEAKGLGPLGLPPPSGAPPL